MQAKGKMSFPSLLFPQRPRKGKVLPEATQQAYRKGGLEPWCHSSHPRAVPENNIVPSFSDPPPPPPAQPGSPYLGTLPCLHTEDGYLTLFPRAPLEPPSLSPAFTPPPVSSCLSIFVFPLSVCLFLTIHHGRTAPSKRQSSR